MAFYHIRNITTEGYYTGNPKKLWTQDLDDAEEFSTKGEAKTVRREFISTNHLYYSSNTVHVTKGKE